MILSKPEDGKEACTDRKPAHPRLQDESGTGSGSRYNSPGGPALVQTSRTSQV